MRHVHKRKIKLLIWLFCSKITEITENFNEEFVNYGGF